MEGFLVDIRIVDHCNPKISLYITQQCNSIDTACLTTGFHTSIDITNVLLLKEEILH